MTAATAAVAAGVLGDRVWMYSNYHCNMACTYCLTDSAPSSPRRQLSAEAMVTVARQAAELGFGALGVTGGEPFLRPDLPETVATMAGILPTVVLSNATQFTGSRIERLRPLVDADVAVQISLDWADAEANDDLRAPDNYARVVDAVPRLVDMGIRVRIGTTLDPDAEVSDEDKARLCTLHRSLGVSDDHHVVRPIVRRGRAAAFDMGVRATAADLPPELTITTDGAFSSPFGPTVRDGVLDTDLLVTRTTDPLATPATALARIVGKLPPGDDAGLGIR
ncbi:MAG TPA: radical SAM protein [Acidimicrobiales bacterium]|nr:radical SAM protein [Acidimicrobiales bacterium]